MKRQGNPDEPNKMMETKMTELRKTFKDFMKNHCLKSLKDCKKHRFLCIILSRNFTLKEREEDIVVNEVFSHQDLSERLKLEFANQTQEECHGSNAAVSIEGCAIKFFPPGNPSDQTGHFFATSVMGSSKTLQL